ncbi:hypothetical protein PTKIN_Ptkin11bG0184100 [Pterospermum kingtungense]
MATSPGDLAALHAILAFPIGAFIPFLILKYHKPEASPFDDNNIIILVFFIATLTYVAAMVTEFKLRIRDSECPKIITSVSHLSATLATISLVTIFFPYLALFLFVIWVGFFAKLALESYQELHQQLADAARCASDLIWKREATEEQNHHQSSTTSSTPDVSNV